MAIAEQQAAQGLISGNLAKDYAACREKAQTIVGNMVELHSRELAGWQWLNTMMEVNPPGEKEEAALWEILLRARRERY